MKAPNDLTKQWQQRLQTWRDSGLSQKEWCTQHDIKQPQFWYWKKKLGVSQHSSPLKKRLCTGYPVSGNSTFTRTNRRITQRINGIRH